MGAHHPPTLLSQQEHEDDGAVAVHGTKDVQLVPAAQPPADPAIGQFLELARSGVAVENIERLMALWERNEARKAEHLWNAAMAAAQKDMRPIAADAWNPQTKSKYASYEQLDLALRPIYTAHGFALTFNTGDAPGQDTVRVLCDVVHEGGHSKPYRLDMPADGKGAKGGDVMTKTHATGSALTYGQRYLLKSIFNIAVGEGDDDGNRASKSDEVRAPDGFENWWLDMELIAEQGLPALSEAWNRAAGGFKNHVAKHAKREWEALKAKAQRAGKPS